MSREWKVGDRFSVEGVVTETADSDGDYQAIFDGHTTAGLTIGAEMACAKLIKPAEEAPKLDVTKPMRILATKCPVKYIEMTESGRYVVEFAGLQTPKDGAELENIPGPKRTYEQIVELVPFEDGPKIAPKSEHGPYMDVKSSAKISYTEGEGWSVEEVL